MPNTYLWDMSFRARFIANVIQFAAQQGVSRQQLLSITGKTMEELHDETLSFEAPVYNQIIEHIVGESSNAHFGLQFGASLALSAAGLVVQIVQSSRTVEEALHYMVSFNNLGCQSLPFSLQQINDEWQLSVQPNFQWEQQSPIAVRHTMDGMMVFTLRQFQSLTRQRYEPLRIHFSYPRPKHFMIYERYFNCSISFSQPTTALFLNKRQVAEPIITSDYQLLQLLVSYAERKLTFLQKNKGFINGVRQIILQLSTPQFPTIEQVADNLNLSVRSFQRRLKEEGLTYKKMIDTLKHQFALEYLKNISLPVKEVAYLLDYADTSSFIRSFKRWEGSSPEEWRKSLD
ncbi:MAG: AraC family transcriptional regulator [Chitinophagales bacterium]|nr:AraC family transcriptional regulator [Chitinophagales bacterium]